MERKPSEKQPVRFENLSTTEYWMYYERAERLIKDGLVISDSVDALAKRIYEGRRHKN